MSTNTPFKKTTWLDATRLLGLIVATFLRGPRSFRFIDPFDAWVRRCEEKYGSVFHIRLPWIDWLLVNDKGLAQRIIEGEPASIGFTAGKTRRDAMKELAPQALTVQNDEVWKRARKYNERVLQPDKLHDGDERFICAIEQAFSKPVSGFEDIQAGMGQVMLAVIFGDRNAAGTLPKLIDEIMDRIENPIRRRLQRGSLEQKRAELYDHLHAHWRVPPTKDDSLMTLARQQAGSSSESSCIEQVPHWMFTFVRSASQWITRSLALILSSPEIHERCLQEAKEAWTSTGPDTSRPLSFIQACMVETARLYPPVVWTFHQCPDGVEHDGRQIAPRTEILQLFTLWHRIREGEAFLPENQLGRDLCGEIPDPLFLGGARCCPGRTLISRLGAFVIARQLTTHRLPAQTVIPMGSLPFAIKDERLQFKTV